MCWRMHEVGLSLEQALVRVLAHARGEVLNDAEVQRFRQLNEQILRRRAASGNAA